VKTFKIKKITSQKTNVKTRSEVPSKTREKEKKKELKVRPKVPFEIKNLTTLILMLRMEMNC
jgi:hypothetical protein